MSDDGIALASAAIWPLIAKENEANKEATQFKKGASGNPDGKKQVTPKAGEPAKRDKKAEHARSTEGQVAAKAGTSRHKASQAIAVHKAIASGELPADTAKDVMSGKKKLKDYGIAPPHSVKTEVDVVRFAANPPSPDPVACPQCGSTNTTSTSPFGSTACKALYRCLACQEPFDYFKPY
jgi:phenylacetate-CoA oxygenase PaaJ subunit